MTGWVRLLMRLTNFDICFNAEQLRIRARLLYILTVYPPSPICVFHQRGDLGNFKAGVKRS